MKFVFRNTNYIPLDCVQFGEFDSTKIIEETVKKNKKLVDINQYFINQNTILLLFLKKPPRRRCHFKLQFIIREGEVIASIYKLHQ